MSDDNKPIGRWLREVDQLLEASFEQVLAPAGRGALEALTTKVQEQRRRVTAGVSDQDYATTVGVLRRMAANLA